MRVGQCVCAAGQLDGSVTTWCGVLCVLCGPAGIEWCPVAKLQFCGAAVCCCGVLCWCGAVGVMVFKNSMNVAAVGVVLSCIVCFLDPARGLWLCWVQPNPTPNQLPVSPAAGSVAFVISCNASATASLLELAFVSWW